MLVLSRKIGEVITIGTSVKIKVLSFDRGVVRLGIEAPKSIPVHRKEIYDKIIEMNRQAAKTELSALKNVLSVRTEMAAAPMASYIRAISAGSDFRRIRPADGLLNLISAMRPIRPLWEMAALKSLMSLRPPPDEGSGRPRCFCASISRFFTSRISSRMECI